MRVAISLEQRFDQAPDGSVWTSGQYPRPFWDRYLDVFDSALVIARVRTVLEPPAGARRADGDGVSFANIPCYKGPLNFLRHRETVTRNAQAAIGHEDAVILRIPSNIANCIQPFLRRTSHPYGVEVVGDPYDVFAPGVVKHPARAYFRHYYTTAQKRQCRLACGAAYVTDRTLQQRYPSAGYNVGISDVEIAKAAIAGVHRAFVTSYSSIELHEPDYVAIKRIQRVTPNCARLVTIGSLEQLYKGTDVLLDAVAKCIRPGRNIKLTVLGDGKHRPALERRAASLGISGNVSFKGHVPAGAPVWQELDAADIFVLPSRTEGLPRAMIEAMARALPCIGSDVGGIPELLPASDLVRAGSVTSLVDKLIEVTADPERMARMSERNLQVAAGFREDVLGARRVQFYRHVRQVTSEWVGSGTVLA